MSANSTRRPVSHSSRNMPHGRPLELVRVTDQGESPLTLSAWSIEHEEVGGVQHAGLVDEITVIPGPASTTSWRRCLGGRVRRGVWQPCQRQFRYFRVSRTRAAFAMGANTITGRCCAWRSDTAACNMRVLPAPAGPTTNTKRSSPATALAEACWPSYQRLVSDRGRWCRVVGLGVERPRQDVLLLGQDMLAGGLVRDRLDPHRPTIRSP